MHEESPGVSIERRSLLLLSGASMVFFGCGRARAAALEDENYVNFLRSAAETLSALLPATTPSQQDEYIYTAAAKVRRAVGIPFPEGMKDTGLDIRPIDKTKVFSIVAYRAAAGVIQPPHNHPGYSVATMGYEGAARVSYFEHDGTPPAYSIRDPFRVRKTSERWLKSRDIATLTPSRDNIHTFEAGPNGARWIDINTELAPGSGDFSYMRLTPATSERTGELYQARWGLKDA
jgi:predicted metal-dependent enzyme (double-stranded beta helix superfamily)